MSNQTLYTLSFSPSGGTREVLGTGIDYEMVMAKIHDHKRHKGITLDELDGEGANFWVSWHETSSPEREGIYDVLAQYHREECKCRDCLVAQIIEEVKAEAMDESHDQPYVPTHYPADPELGALFDQALPDLREVAQRHGFYLDLIRDREGAWFFYPSVAEEEDSVMTEEDWMAATADDQRDFCMHSPSGL